MLWSFDYDTFTLNYIQAIIRCGFSKIRLNQMIFYSLFSFWSLFSYSNFVNFSLSHWKTFSGDFKTQDIPEKKQVISIVFTMICFSCSLLKARLNKNPWKLILFFGKNTSIEPKMVAKSSSAAGRADVGLLKHVWIWNLKLTKKVK